MVIDTIQETAAGLSDFLGAVPVIESDLDSGVAKLQLDRGKLNLKDLDDERDGLVRPLNAQVREINERYRKPKELLQRLVGELGSRISDYLRRQEAERERIAVEARRKAEEAEAIARAAEAVEFEAIANAAEGEVIDLKPLIEKSNDAFDDALVAARKAELAEREQHVKLGGGFTRAASLRTVETLEVIDAIAAVQTLGTTADIAQAIIKGARAFRKIHGMLPPGIKVTTERKV